MRLASGVRMSAIRKLIEEVRRLTFTNTVQHMRWHDKADAAEAELKVLETLEYTVERLHAMLLERDRADAELREWVVGINEQVPSAGDLYALLSVAKRWAVKGSTRIVDEMMASRPPPEVRKVAKDGKECAWCGRVACDIEEHKQRPLRAPRLPDNVSLEKWGASNGVAPESEKCPTCKGKGEYRHLDAHSSYVADCEDCNGTGKVGGGK